MSLPSGRCLSPASVPALRTVLRALWRPLLAALALLVAFQAAVEVAEWGWSPGSWHALDAALRARVASQRTPARTAAVNAFTDAGGVPVALGVGIAVLAALLARRERVRAAAWATALGLGQAVVFGAKVFYQRPRPTDAIVPVHGFSFPSAHAFTAVVLYGLLAWLAWPYLRTTCGRALTAAAALSMGLAIGASRVYLGVHYPTDVLAGWALGAAWLLVARWAVRTTVVADKGVRASRALQVEEAPVQESGQGPR